MKLLIITTFCNFIMILGIAQDDYKFRNNVKSFISQTNDNFQFAMIGEAVNGKLAAVLFWPCLMGNEFIDDKVMVLGLQKSGPNWEAVELFPANEGTGTTRISEFLETKDYQFTRQKGVLNLDSLASRISNDVHLFQTDINAEKGKEAGEEIEDFLAMFSIDISAYSSLLTHLVMKGIDSIELEDIIKSDETNATGTLTIFHKTGAVIYKTKMRDFGDGWRITELNKGE